MKCLCCGKTIKEDASVQERESKWHASCIRKFYGTDALPDIHISEEMIVNGGNTSIHNGLTVPGIQKKLLVYLHENDGQSCLSFSYSPVSFILKPQTEKYTALPEAEYLVMKMAVAPGIRIVPCALMTMNDKSNSFSYITKRVDRMDTQLLVMEDFCQLEQRLTENKDKGSYERCAKVITRYSATPGIDLSELFLRIVFCFVTGNSDMHLKNFSLIETKPGSQVYMLSPAYDLLPVNVILPEYNEQMALSLHGKKRNLHRNDFLAFAETAGIPIPAAKQMISKIISMKDSYLNMCNESYLHRDMKERFCNLIEARIAALQ